MNVQFVTTAGITRMNVVTRHCCFNTVQY